MGALCRAVSSQHSAAGRKVEAALNGATPLSDLSAEDGANRDPAVFDHIAISDASRINAREHHSFGTAVHACLGATLASMNFVSACRDCSSTVPTYASPVNRPSTGVSCHTDSYIYRSHFRPRKQSPLKTPASNLLLREPNSVVV